DATGDTSSPAATFAAALPAWALLLGLLIPDLVLSLVAALLTRRYTPLRFAPAFFLMRTIDAALCLRSLIETYARRRTATGQWTSPVRRPRHAITSQAR